MSELKVLIDEDQIVERICQLAEKIDADYANKELVLLCILKGSIYFLVDLSKRLKTEHKLEFMKVSSYSGTESTGVVTPLLDVREEDVQGKDVLIVEDIIDTGITLDNLFSHIKTKKVNSLRICTLLDKKARRKVESVHVDYVGFEIPDEFVVGYGLDLDDEYRHYTSIKCFTDSSSAEFASKKQKIKIPEL